MEIRADEIARIIREQLGGFAAGVDVSEVGTVLADRGFGDQHLYLNIAELGFKLFHQGSDRAMHIACFIR